jgi:SpoU rRNA methylase family enzyme
MRGWKRIMFAGNGAMPVVVDSSAGALKEVGQHLGAIAIVGLLEAQVGEQAKVALPLHEKPSSSP